MGRAQILLMKLSIIVPVYNVEKFLPRCLDSLLRQSIEEGEYEVICVNDGSPDGCAQILEEYKQNHSNVFKVITQENKGLGEARNAGMKIAQGEWIVFIDSDDYVIDNAFRYLLDHFCQDKEGEDKIDVLHYNFSEIFTDGVVVHDPDAKPDGIVTFEGDGAAVYHFSMNCVWTQFYRRTFLIEHGIWMENVFCEDELFNFEVFSRHPRMRVISSNIIRYEKGTDDSLMTTTKKEKVLVQLDDLLYDIHRINKYLKENECMESTARRVINLLWGTFYTKLTYSFLSWKEWHYYYRKKSALPQYEPDFSDSDRSARWLLKSKMMAGDFYLFYIFFAFLRNVIFVKYCRPLIVKREKSTQ